MEILHEQNLLSINWKIMNKKQTFNTTHSVKKKRKRKDLSGTWYDDWRFINTWRETGPPTETFFDELIRKMFDHFSDPENLDIVLYLTSLGIDWDVFNAWRPGHPELDSAYKLILSKVGALREQKAIYKKYNTNPGVIVSTLHAYHPIWRKVVDEEIAVTTSKNQDHPAIVNVTIPKLGE